LRVENPGRTPIRREGPERIGLETDIDRDDGKCVVEHFNPVSGGTLNTKESGDAKGNGHCSPATSHHVAERPSLWTAVSTNRAKIRSSTAPHRPISCSQNCRPHRGSRARRDMPGAFATPARAAAGRRLNVGWLDAAREVLVIKAVHDS